MDNTTAKEVHQKPSVDQTQRFQQDKPLPVFQEFSWYERKPECQKEALIQDASDISSGIASIMGLLEQSHMAIECGDAPILPPVEQGHLMRMVVASAHMLASACSQNIESTNEDFRRQKAHAGSQR